MKISDTRLQNFRKVLAEQKLRLTDIADRLGKAPAQVSAFGGKNPTKGIGDQIAREIEKALLLPHGYLDIPFGWSQPTDAAANATGRKLPVIRSVAAGNWRLSEDEFDPSGAEEWIDSPGPVGRKAFILLIEGLSMEPRFVEGDKVVIDPSIDALPGDFVAVQKGGGGAMTLKQLKQEGAELYLLALNPDWPNRIIRMTDEWSICGKALWKISKL